MLTLILPYILHSTSLFPPEDVSVVDIHSYDVGTYEYVHYGSRGGTTLGYKRVITQLKVTN